MTIRLTALLVTTALLGFLVGARAVGGPTAMASSASTAGQRDVDPLRGSFWRPAGSDAARPAVRLERVGWTPSAAKPHDTPPDTRSALQALVRLASLD
jgi:hypothetical protein